MRILMLNLPFAGHTNPTLPLTRELVTRGHDVTYINAADFGAKIEACGATFVPYRNYPRNPSEEEKKRLCFRALYETAMALKDPFDLLIYEMFFYPGIEIAERKGIPCVRQFSQPAWSVETWREAPLAFKISAKLIDVQVLPKRVAKELGLQNQCLRDGIIKSRPALNLVYVPEDFQPERESFGDDYLFLVPFESPSGMPTGIHPGSFCIPYEEMRPPILYISLGSIISNKGFCKECIRAFGGTEFSVILNTGRVPVASLGTLPQNIHAYSFVPQIEVLSHADVFLTHCGMNSVNEALSFGVPMVAMPFINDQVTNARQIVEKGLGRRVRSFPSSGRELLRAAREVYAAPGYKDQAEEMRIRIKQQVSLEEVVGRIESLA